MKAVVFDATIPRYVATRAVGALSSRLLTGAGRTTRLAEVAVPELPGPRWVRVRARLGGVCGSDLNLVQLKVSPSMSPFSSSPFVIGHENVGTIETVGAEVRGFAPGERVVVNPLLACEAREIAPPCRHCAEGMPSRCEHFTDGAVAPGMLIGTTRGLGGSWGESFVAHQSQLWRVPPAMSDRAAVLVEPFASVLSPVLANPPAAKAKVLVIGAGSVGLMATAALGAVAPAAEVTVLARHEFQAEEARRLGARQVVLARGGDAYFDELARFCGGRLLQPILGKRIQVGGFDVSLVCVGTEGAVDDALRFTRSGGEIIMVGNVARLPGVDWTPLWAKSLTVRGSLCYDRHAHGGAGRDTFGAAMELFGGGLAARLEPLVTHVFPVKRFAEALEVAMGKAGHRSVKIVFEHPA